VVENAKRPRKREDQNQKQRKKSITRNEHKQLLTNLQGEWKRTTYPFGTVEFEDRKVKLTEGEGLVEPSQFEQFELSNQSPLVANAPSLFGKEAYLVRANQGY